MKLDVRPRLALGNAVLQTAGSALCLAHEDEMVPTAGFAPASPRSQRGMLTVTTCRVFKMEPPVGLPLLRLHSFRSAPHDCALSRTALAPTWTCLQDRRLSMSATETGKCGEPGRLESLPHSGKNGAACRCCPDVSSLEDSHVSVTSMPRSWPLEWVARPPVRIFNPPLICLSHPAFGPSAW